MPGFYPLSVQKTAENIVKVTKYFLYTDAFKQKKHTEGQMKLQ